MDQAKQQSPGQVLVRDFLEPFNIHQKDLADHLNWTPARLNELIKEKRSLTADSALSLAHALGTTPEYWMDLQRDLDLRKAGLTHVAPKRLIK